MIKDEEITFIVTGKIFYNKNITLKSLKSIKKYFPSSTIILSTWEDENTNELEQFCNKIIKNKPLTKHISACLPECDWYPKYNSYNSQQLSVSTALKICNTKYVVRLRSDFILTKKSFLNYYNFYKNLLPHSSTIFKDKIIIYSCGTINPFCDVLPLPQHPSDLFFFGLREDLCEIYNGNFIPDEIANYYSKNKDKTNPCLFNHLYTPEQYLWLQTLDNKKVNYKKPLNYYDIDETIKEETLKFFIDNFIILDSKQIGIISKFDKKFTAQKANKRFITNLKFIEFCKNRYSNIHIDQLYKQELLYTNLEILKSGCLKHFKALLKNLCNTFSEFISTIFYMFKFLFYCGFYIIKIFYKINHKILWSFHPNKNFYSKINK